MDDLKRGQRLGKYELLLRIGRGGMATVWVALEHAENKADERLVAVKAILADLADDPEFVSMFLDEGRLVRSIRHSSVVDVYEVGEHDGVMYMAMEWVEGDSLHAVIAEAGKRKPIPPEMAIRIIADAAAGLHAAHEQTGDDGKPLNVVHRDVSPHNILIGTAGQVKLVDFGVAKAMGRLSQATSAGQLKGKFGYMSPEQAMAKPIDRRSDVFSLGIVLFELTTGRRLFKGEHDAETLHLVVSGEIPKPTTIEADYPKGLEEIVLKALARDLDQRYATAKELQDALEGFLKQQKVVVASSGLGALLKKVLGSRIEQRRKAIRAILRSGEEDTKRGLIPTDTAFTPSSGEHASVTGVSSVTGPSGVSQLTGASVADPGSHSGVSQTSATAPHSVSRSRPRDTPLGYVVGIGGLALGLLAVVFFVLKGGDSSRAELPAAPATVGAAASERPVKAAPATKVDDGLEAVSLDQLEAEKIADGGASRPSARPAAKSGPGSAPAVAPSPAAAPAAAPAPVAPPKPADPTGLPRDNPYGN